MKSVKEGFIKLALSCKALQFGTFKLKSGRISPYFFNAGLFYEGHALKLLGEYYAKTLLNHNIHPQHLFGPAYKGLPIATATAVALSHLGIETKVTFNRKETKDHGEGGLLMGAPLHGDIVFVDDVITAGTAFKEAQSIITSHGAKPSAVIVALDRAERGQGNQSTLDEIKQQGIEVCAIITYFDLIDYLKKNQEHHMAAQLEHYHKAHQPRT